LCRTLPAPVSLLRCAQLGLCAAMHLACKTRANGPCSSNPDLHACLHALKE
jgi:hypothetical protein